jgi:hypothetical protein
MFTITKEQRWVLLDHAMECNQLNVDGERSVEARFADVLADFSAGRPIEDRDLLVRFLWQRVSLALVGLEYGTRDAAAELNAWHAAVTLLDQLGEDLDDIYAGRSIEMWAEAERVKVERYRALVREAAKPTLADIAAVWGLPLEVAESIASYYES